ncbi:MAG: Na+/H+ antiporter NhaA [Microbacterium sp.]
MSLLRSERFPAVLLLAAAAAGLALAGSPAGDAVLAVKDAHGAGPFALSAGHWISDGLLAVFFVVAAVELRVEVTAGELASWRRGVLPALAAAGGVVLPILLFLAVSAGSSSAQGWPVPTATDIAFALGVLAVFGRGLPSSLRVFLLALAILDDIVGIVFIAVLFTAGLDPAALLGALVLVVAFGAVSRVLTPRTRLPLGALLVLLAGGAWALVHLSGVHATIAGVALGLAMRQQPALRVRHALEPWVNALILPLFAFSAALVPVPEVGLDALRPVFWAVAVALPLGKLLGISGACWLGQRMLRVPAEHRLPAADLLAVGALGGIGFTVSLLLAELAFAGDPVLRDEAVLGVLTGSAISLVLAAVLVSWRARRVRRRSEATG